MGAASNIAFSLLVKISGRLREFNFRQRSDLNYDTDTSDERGNRCIFRVVKENGAWKITGRELPNWLLENDFILHEPLETHNK